MAVVHQQLLSLDQADVLALVPALEYPVHALGAVLRLDLEGLGGFAVGVREVAVEGGEGEARVAGGHGAFDVAVTAEEEMVLCCAIMCK